jgi:hypothetical protein
VLAEVDYNKSILLVKEKSNADQFSWGGADGDRVAAFAGSQW